MFNLILFEPEIPPNTGNIIRLCANSGARLHLIEPLGFSLNEKKLRRAGLDYSELAEIKMHASLVKCCNFLDSPRLFAFSTKGTISHDVPNYKKNDTFLFGPETRGLPLNILNSPIVEEILKIPMRPGNRSLNLSNAVAIVVYEAWRQLNFFGAEVIQPEDL